LKKKKRVRYRGQAYEVEGDKTVAEMKEEFGVPPDYILVDDKGKQLRDSKKVEEEVEEDSGVMPLVQPQYGGN